MRHLRHPIAGLVHHRPATIPATEARAQLLLVAVVLTTASLVSIYVLVSIK